MRTIRDIPAESIISGSKVSNMRQIVLERLKSEGTTCKCIRCREVGLQTERVMDKNSSGFIRDEKPVLFTEEYEASGGKELFLSYETKDRKTLYSLLRLRFPGPSSRVERVDLEVTSQKASRNDKYLPEIKNCALIREVHTYGQEVSVGKEGKIQHIGFGKKLIAEAEKIAKSNGYKKIAVISGVGVRDYYRKLGYKTNGTYLVKKIQLSNQ
jgi:elongator complex protein 3